MMSTEAEAIADYQRLKASGGVAAPPAAAGRPTPDPTHQAALDHSVRLLVPSYRQAEQQRAAEAAADRQAALPPPLPPRDTLRQAHQARADATAEGERLHSAVDRAQAHVVEVTAHRDGLQHDIEVDEAADTERLIRELAAGTTGRVEPAAGEKRVALAEAAHQVSVAQRAADRLAGDLAAAQQRLEAAGARVTQAVCAVLLEVARDEAETILRAADELDARRAGLDALSIEVTNRQRSVGGASRLPWPPQIREALSPELRGAPRLPSKFATPEGAHQVRRWRTVASALLADPEAPLAEGES
jgi:hypothetical protein